MKTLLPLLVGITAFASCLCAQQITPEFADSYSITSFNSPWGEIGHAPLWIPFPGTEDVATALQPQQSSANLYFYRLSRTPTVGGHLDGFNEGAPHGTFSTAPYIDGGVTLYLGTHSPVIAYTTTQGELGINANGTISGFSLPQFGASGGTLTDTPPGIGRSDNLTLIGNGGTFLTGTLSGDTIATLSLSVTDTGIHLVDHAEGVAYVTTPVHLIGSPSLLVLDAGAFGTLSVFTLDTQGLPIASSKRAIATGIPDAYGLAIDNITGDALVSGNNGGTIYEIQGFTSVPEPYSCGVAALLLLGFAAVWRNSSHHAK